MESCDEMMAVVLDRDKATLDCAKQKLFHKDHTQLLSTAPLRLPPKTPQTRPLVLPSHNGFPSQPSLTLEQQHSGC